MAEKLKNRTLRLNDDETTMVAHWAKKLGTSENDFIREALEFYVAYRAHDVPVHDVLVERTNELTGLITSMSDTMTGLTGQVGLLIETLVTIGQAGSNRLSSPESGELRGTARKGE